MHKMLLLIPFIGLTGCSALQGIQQDAAHFIQAAADSGATEKIVQAVASPSIVTASHAIAALLTVVAGGAGGVYGYRKGANGK